jgi:hypothetical protein
VTGNGVAAGFTALFVLLFFGLWIAGFIFWIVRLVEVCRIPDYQYRSVGSDKVTWVLVLALTQIIGALIWQFSRRRDVLAAAGLPPPPVTVVAPPGWYLDPQGSGSYLWWDGMCWTGHRAPPPPPPPSGGFLGNALS